MSDQDVVSDQARKREEEYFRKRDRELIERMRAAAAAEQSRRDLEARTGLHDPALLRDLEELGFTPDTIALLPLVPIVQVAWAEGGVSDSERRLILEFARARNIVPGSAADRQLAEWLDRRPAEQVFAKATRLVRAMLDSPGDMPAQISADELIASSERIAAASGGILGIGRISAGERAALEQIAAALKRG